MLNFLITGTIFGLSAGLSPGPLLTLVISETLTYNLKAGIKVAVAPLITDLPILLFSFLILTKFSQYQKFLGIISLVGAAFIFYLGFQCQNTKTFQVNIQEKSQSLRKGVLVNLLNPHPYLFWITVGSPLIFRAYRQNIFSAIAFIAAFYFCLVGSKIIIALLVGRFKQFLSGKIFVYLRRILGLILWVFGVLFLMEGFRLLYLN